MKSKNSFLKMQSRMGLGERQSHSIFYELEKNGYFYDKTIQQAVTDYFEGKITKKHLENIIDKESEEEGKER